MKSAQFGGEEVLENGLQLENANSGGRLEIVVSSASAQLEGSVVEDDQPLAGATVRVTPDPETPITRFDEAIPGRIKRGIIPCPALRQESIR